MSLLPDDATCGTCRFFDPTTESVADSGACRRYAPRVQFERTYNVKAERWLREAYAMWPLVAPYDWCGEHQPKATV